MNAKGERYAIEQMASTLSNMTRKPWYVCEKKGEFYKALTEENLSRYLQLGYKVHCAFYRGERYKNVYTIGDGVQCVR